MMRWSKCTTTSPRPPISCPPRLLPILALACSNPIDFLATIQSRVGRLPVPVNPLLQMSFSASHLRFCRSKTRRIFARSLRLWLRDAFPERSLRHYVCTVFLVVQVVRGCHLRCV